MELQIYPILYKINNLKCYKWIYASKFVVMYKVFYSVLVTFTYFSNKSTLLIITSNLPNKIQPYPYSNK